jgi:hypothetical protein
MRHYRETDWLDIPTDPSDTREEEPEHDPDCPTAEEFAATPEKFVWVAPFKDKFQVRCYDTEAAIGEEVVTICDKPTMAEAEQAKADYIRQCKCCGPMAAFGGKKGNCWAKTIIQSELRRFWTILCGGSNK